MEFGIAPQLIEEARVIAAELVKSDRQTIEIRSTDFFVTVDPGNKVVIHEFKCENISCYITMRR
jgi:hypothetical protein